MSNPNLFLKKAPADGLQGLKENYKSDILSGFLVFLIALPLCLGISMASGFPPIGGIFTAIIGGILVGLTGGARLTIKGPAAGLIAIAAASVEALGQGEADPMAGYKYTLAVIVVAGIIQVVFGLLKAGKLGDFFPASAVHGMLAAIGIIIISKQIHTIFGVKATAKEPLELLAEIPHTLANLNPDIAIIGLVSLAILIGLPLIKNKYVKMIPAPMVVILVAIPLGHYFDLEHEHKYLFLQHHYTVSPKFLVTLPDSMLSGIQMPLWGKIMSFESLKYVIMFALVGSIESLLTVKAIDGLDPYKRKSDMNRDLVAVGAGNALAGMIGGLPMIAEVVRSSSNVANGAKTRWANVAHGLFLLLFVALAPGLIHQIPLAALAAMLVFTGYRLGSPVQFLSTYKIGRDQLIIFTTTVILTLATDLLIGVAAGIFVKFLLHMIAGIRAKEFFTLKVEYQETGNDSVLIKVKSPALFSNFLIMKPYFDRAPRGRKLTLDLTEVHMIDHSFMEHIHTFTHEYGHTEGGHVDIIGMETLEVVSDHPLAARKKTAARV